MRRVKQTISFKNYYLFFEHVILLQFLSMNQQSNTIFTTTKKKRYITIEKTSNSPNRTNEKMGHFDFAEQIKSVRRVLLFVVM